MGINVGSGGLKFQPVNHAQISARKAAASASAGGSASASAYGTNRRYSLGQQRLQHSAIQGALNRRSRYNLQALGNQNRLALQANAYQNQQGLNQQRYDLQQQGLDAEYQQAQDTMEQITPPTNASPGDAYSTPAGNANAGPTPVNNAQDHAAVPPGGVYPHNGKWKRKKQPPPGMVRPPSLYGDRYPAPWDRLAGNGGANGGANGGGNARY